jgi:hypothetical protein
VLGAVAAYLKNDGRESSTCVYNEYVAARLGELFGLPVAAGVLVAAPLAKAFASLLPVNQECARLPHIEWRLS